PMEIDLEIVIVDVEDLVRVERVVEQIAQRVAIERLAHALGRLEIGPCGLGALQHLAVSGGDPLALVVHRPDSTTAMTNLTRLRYLPLRRATDCGISGGK